MESIKKFIPAILGLLLIGAGVFFYFRASELAKVCTEKAEAKVVNMREDYEITEDNVTRYIYYPVIEYQANGKTVTGELSSSSSPSHSVNDTVDILYNPNKVDEFIVVGENQHLAAIAFGLVGVVFLVVGIVTAVKKPDSKTES